MSVSIDGILKGMGATENGLVNVLHSLAANMYLQINEHLMKTICNEFSKLSLYIGGGVQYWETASRTANTLSMFGVACSPFIVVYRSNNVNSINPQTIMVRVDMNNLNCAMVFWIFIACHALYCVLLLLCRLSRATIYTFCLAFD